MASPAQSGLSRGGNQVQATRLQVMVISVSSMRIYVDRPAQSHPIHRHAPHSPPIHPCVPPFRSSPVRSVRWKSCSVQAMPIRPIIRPTPPSQQMQATDGEPKHVKMVSPTKSQRARPTHPRQIQIHNQSAPFRPHTCPGLWRGWISGWRIKPHTFLWWWQYITEKTPKNIPAAAQKDTPVDLFCLLFFPFFSFLFLYFFPSWARRARVRGHIEARPILVAQQR